MRNSAIFVAMIVAQSLTAQDGVDWRNIRNGRVIPTSSYADQPYIVKTDDGAWLCIVTTGAKKEGDRGQTVAVLRSKDKGKTWTTPLPLEPTDGPESSYAVLLKTPSGRVYAFYNHNTDNVREVPRDVVPGKPKTMEKRVDSLGHFVFRFSDDHGVTWSPKRYDIPMREFKIDRENSTGGKIKFFWNVGKPFVRGTDAYVSIHKVGGFGEGFFTKSEGAFLKSDNILTERNPELIRWITLPEGDVGIRPPLFTEGAGPIAEEQSTVVLSDGSLYCVFRTIEGHPAFTVSRDGGRTWAATEYLGYANGEFVKHPRAANFVWKCANGKYLYWFHNHGGWFIGKNDKRRTMSYEDRNPAWLCGGVETDTPLGKTIKWSQPEIVLYDDDPMIRISYPDLVEDGGYFLTETQKNIARVHEIDSKLIEGLWSQFDDPKPVEGEMFGRALKDEKVRGDWPLKPLPTFVIRDDARPDHGTKDLRRGFTIEVWVRFDKLKAGQTLVSNLRDRHGGFLLETASRGTVELFLRDERSESRWSGRWDQLKEDEWSHIVAIVDGGPKIISFVVNGRFDDGGFTRQFGWGRFPPSFKGPDLGPIFGPHDGRLWIAPDGNGPRDIKGEFARVRIFDRALRISEAVDEYRLGVERHLKK